MVPQKLETVLPIVFPYQPVFSDQGNITLSISLCFITLYASLWCKYHLLSQPLACKLWPSSEALLCILQPSKVGLVGTYIDEVRVFSTVAHDDGSPPLKPSWPLCYPLCHFHFATLPYAIHFANLSNIGRRAIYASLVEIKTFFVLLGPSVSSVASSSLAWLSVLSLLFPFWLLMVFHLFLTGFSIVLWHVVSCLSDQRDQRRPRNILY